MLPHGRPLTKQGTQTDHQPLATRLLAEQSRLIARARDRDEATWAAIFDAHFDSLCRYAFYRVSDHHKAEELAAQVFEEALRGIGRFEDRGISLRAWLFRIAHNLVVDHLATSTKKPQAVLQDLPSGTDDLEAAGVRTDILQALSALEDGQRQVVCMTVLEDLSVDDCASVLAQKPADVRRLQLRGLNQLRTLLTDPKVVAA